MPFLSRIVVPWRSEPQIFETKCLRTALSCATVVLVSVPDILHSCKRTSRFLQSEYGIDHSADQFFPCGENWLGTRLPLFLLPIFPTVYGNVTIKPA